MTSPRTLLFILVATVILGVGFYSFPEWDLGFSALFYNSEQGFYLKDYPLVLFSYYGNRYFAATLVAILLVLLGITIKTRKTILGLDNKGYSYVLVVAVIGPVLIVNSLFKSNWGRARPEDVTQFGGQMTFTPAFVISDQCSQNCSFVSGHPSVFFALIALGLLYKGRTRVTIVSLATSLGALVGLGRIMQGGHFLSDVVFSFVFILLTALVIYRIMYKEDQNA
ncbi:MAG: phosphatase PAP2 family protein [Gammaproteobacteria bacterium]|nr:MAG: phosphatase PAP2 family protein [Gammaproteobacteria bacterium]